MTNPETYNGNDNNPSGGPPMVKIDGAAVRRVREQKGLTQLYVATVVQVTTDTISRWENRRYPSIKKENAEKLAEALEVEVTVLLEQEEPPNVPPAVVEQPLAPEPLPESTPPASPAQSPRRLRSLAGGLLLAAVLLLGFLYFFAVSPGRPPVITATRILPEHVPPGQVFPVLLRVSTQPTAALALIIRESLPPGCRFTQASPAITGSPGPDGQIKWVSRLEGKDRLFAYLLTSPTGAADGSTLAFRGQVVAGSRGEAGVAIGGNAQLTVSPYHWADRNSDNLIDDEEILAVYDRFGDVKEFAALRDEVDRLWTGGGYRWDAATHRYLVGK